MSEHKNLSTNPNTNLDAPSSPIAATTAESPEVSTPLTPAEAAAAAAEVEAETAKLADKRARRAAQNRLNAQKSTGPKSPEGKARSRANAIQHGLTNRVTHCDKDRDDVHRLNHLLQNDYHPQGELEFQAIDRIALNQHRSGSLSQQISTLEHYLAHQTSDVPAGSNITGCIALLGDDEPKRVHRIDLLHRYRRDNDRDWRDNTNMLLRLQRARRIERREEAADERRRRRDQYDAHFQNSFDNQIRNRRGEQIFDPEDPHNSKLERLEKERWHAQQDVWRKEEEDRQRLKEEKERQKQAAEEQKKKEEEAAEAQPQPKPATTEKNTLNSPNEPSQPEPNQPLTPDTKPIN